MKNTTIIQEAEKFARERLRGADPGHDLFHIERVRNNARAILEHERGDEMIVELAILLHDVGDRKVLRSDKDDHSVARVFLESQKLDTGSIDRIMFIIENMSFSKTLNSKIENPPVELMVVQDADRLDAIGAIGVARAFVFGESRGRPMYDPEKKAQNIDTPEQYQKMESSTLHHFEEKLLLLKDLMNTATAKKIAEGWHAFMERYLEEFLAEWRGER